MRPLVFGFDDWPGRGGSGALNTRCGPLGTLTPVVATPSRVRLWGLPNARFPTVETNARTHARHTAVRTSPGAATPRFVWPSGLTASAC
jgi:hypothetical protein